MHLWKASSPPAQSLILTHLGEHIYFTMNLKLAQRAKISFPAKLSHSACWYKLVVMKAESLATKPNSFQWKSLHCPWPRVVHEVRKIARSVVFFFLPTFVAMNSSTRARLPAQFYCNLLGFVANLTQSFLTTCLNFNFFLLNTSFPFPQTKFKVQMQFWHRGGDAACIHMKQEPGMVAKFKSENVFAQCEQSHSIFRVAEWHYSSSWTFV